jgi:hypothetical protein
MAKYNSVTEDEIERTKNYKEALDELQKSLTGLNSKLPSFADGMKAGLLAIGEKLPEVVQSMVDLNKQNNELAASGGKPVSVLKQLASSMLSWNTLISVGVTLLATYGGAIIDWVGGLLKGETRLTALGKAMKEQAIVADAVAQARLKGAQSAQGEITALDTLYRATQNKNLADEERKKAMAALREVWPATFKGLDDEAFKTKKAADAYKDLKVRIMDAAYAEAYKNRITANASRSIDDDLRIAKEKEKNAQILKELKNAQKQLDGTISSGDNMGMGYLSNLWSVDKIRNKLAASDKIISDFVTDKKILSMQNEKFATEIDKLTQKKNNGVAIITGHQQGDTDDKKKGTGKDKVGDDAAQIGQESILILNEYNNQVKTTNDYYEKLRANKKLSAKQREDIEKNHQEALQQIVDKFRREDVDKLTQFKHKLAQITIDSTQDAKQKALLQAEEDKKQKLEDFDKETASLTQRIEEEQRQLAGLNGKGTEQQHKALQQSIDQQKEALKRAGDVRINYETQLNAQIEEIRINNNKTENTGDNTTQSSSSQVQTNQSQQDEVNNNPTIKQQLSILKVQHDNALKNTTLTADAVFKIESTYAKKKAELEDSLIMSKIHAGDKYINAVLANTKKDSAIYKAAFLAKKATSIADVIISTKKGIIGSFEGYAHLPFIGQALAIAQAAFIAGQGAASIATIAKQKPGFAAGGQYFSDGRGALLPGYSRTDNTNAYLRSGEAVVVSEAMRNPWARNLVSAINVAHGGRDFSVPNMGKGYAVGGIFTDGGNANRYYNQPVNDIKDMANTLAYQMINNFPPIYVDVKDVNNQQNILAQTVNRVNL